MRIRPTLGLHACRAALAFALAAAGSQAAAAQQAPGSPPTNPSRAAPRTAQSGAQVQPAVAGPIVAMPGIIPLGFIEPRSAVTREVTLRNTSSAPIKIVKAVPGCTCTTLDVAGKVIPAMGELKVPITMKVAGSTGVKTANVQFVLEGVPSILTVGMQGEVAYPVRAVQRDAATGAKAPYVDAFATPANVKGEIEVVATDGKPFRVTSVQGEPPEYVGYNPAEAPRSAYTLRYDISSYPCPQMPPYLIVGTDRADAPVIDMRVRHACTKIEPIVPFAEFRTNLGAVAPGSAHEFDFELKQAKGWLATGATCDDPRVRIEFVQQKAVDPQGHSLVALRATFAADAKGLVLVPVTMLATAPNGKAVSSRFWLYADVRAP